MVARASLLGLQLTGLRSHLISFSSAERCS